MINLLKARLRHGYQAIPDPLTVPIHESFPGLPFLQPNADLNTLNHLCPLKAFSEKGLDLGKCIFCGICEREHPEMIEFKPNYQIASDAREKLIIAPGQEKLPPIMPINPRLIHRSFALRNVSAGGCNACEADTNVLTTIVFDLSRFGIRFVASPRHADGLLITGPVTENMALALQKTYDALAEPRLVIAVGACAIAGGPFAGQAEVRNGATALLPVDLFIPGCPPHPITILDGLLRLLGRLPAN